MSAWLPRMRLARATARAGTRISSALAAREAALETAPGSRPWSRAWAVAQLVYALEVGVLAALYYGSARLGYELKFAGPVAAIVWLPAGVGIAFLYLRGLRFWPGILIGDLLANDYSALPLASAIGQTCGNIVEVVGSTLLLRLLVRRGSPIGSARGVGRMVVAITLGAAVSATVGALSILPSDVISRDEFLKVWRTWWLGDSCGALIVVPLALAWWRRPRLQLGTSRMIEAALLVAATIVLSEIAFRTDEPLVYLIFPALIWAALRFGRRGATLAVTISVSLSIWNTTHSSGPFVYTSIDRSVLNTQLFIAVAALSALWLAAVVSERKTLSAGLAASRARLLEATDAERRRFERDLHDGAQQRLTAVALRLHEAEAKGVAGSAEAASLLAETEAELQSAIGELRELAHGLHPAVLTDFGLAKAINGIAAGSPVPVEVVAVPTGRLDDLTEATAYYVVAEAVTNAQRYAKPTSIRISATLSHEMLELVVSDDGSGGAVASHGSGLEGLRDRVEAVGGTFGLISPAGAGTRVVAHLPADAPSAG